MRKHCSNVCKLRPCLAAESTSSARMRTIVTAALQQQYSQTELIFWITLVFYPQCGEQNVQHNRDQTHLTLVSLHAL